MKKRIVSILLVAAMSVSLFACGSKESRKTNAETSGSNCILDSGAIS